MQNQSLVECINNSGFEEFVKLKTPYTIRKIIKKGTIISTPFDIVAIITDGVYLEEVIAPDIIIATVIFERMFPLQYFRELLPPIANIEEHINKEVLKPELV